MAVHYSECKIVAQIRWTIVEAFSKAGVPTTEENIDRFILDRHATQTLEDVSIQYGWDILSDIISILQNDGILPETKKINSTRTTH